MSELNLDTKVCGINHNTTPSQFTAAPSISESMVLRRLRGLKKGILQFSDKNKTMATVSLRSSGKLFKSLILPLIVDYFFLLQFD